MEAIRQIEQQIEEFFAEDIEYDPKVFNIRRAQSAELEKLFNDVHYSELPSLLNFYPHIYRWPGVVPPPGIYRMRFDAATSSQKVMRVWRKSGTTYKYFLKSKLPYTVMSGRALHEDIRATAVTCGERAIFIVYASEKE